MSAVRKSSAIYFVEALGLYFRDRPIADISRQDIERYKKHRLDDGAGNSTINHELATLRRMFNLAIKFWEHPDNKQEYIFNGRNPAEGFDKLPEEPRERKLTKGELIKLVNHLMARAGLVRDEKVKPVTNGRDLKGYKRLLDFILFAVMTGMRKALPPTRFSGWRETSFPRWTHCKSLLTPLPARQQLRFAQWMMRANMALLL